MKYLISKFDESILSSGHTITCPVQGLFVTSMPEGISISDPSDYTTLVSDKHEAILSTYEDYDEVVYDEFDTDDFINYVNSTHFCHVGKYEVMLPATSGEVRSTSRTLSVDASTVMAFWSVFTLTKTATSFGGYNIAYEELDPGEVTVSISVDGGSTFTEVVYGVPSDIATAGNDFVIKVTNSAAYSIYLNYYSVIYKE